MNLGPFGNGPEPHIPVAMAKKFRDNTVPIEDGHQIWKGSFWSSSSTPFMYFEKRQVPATSIAFIMRTGRWPVGYVKSLCGVRHCVGFRCVEDREGRARLNEQISALGLRVRRKYPG